MGIPVYRDTDIVHLAVPKFPDASRKHSREAGVWKLHLKQAVQSDTDEVCVSAASCVLDAGGLRRLNNAPRDTITRARCAALSPTA
eukprot:1913237-Pleurochrysis_carterae.AAC.6